MIKPVKTSFQLYIPWELRRLEMIKPVSRRLEMIKPVSRRLEMDKPVSRRLEMKIHGF